MKYQKTVKLEVSISGRVQTRKEFEKSCFVTHFSDNHLQYRAIVDHPNGRMEWKWCKTLKEAKQWVNSIIGTYRTFGTP